LRINLGKAYAFWKAETKIGARHRQLRGAATRRQPQFMSERL
jgi:hypothetical protein